MRRLFCPDSQPQTHTLPEGRLSYDREKKGVFHGAMVGVINGFAWGYFTPISSGVISPYLQPVFKAPSCNLTLCKLPRFVLEVLNSMPSRLGLAKKTQHNFDPLWQYCRQVCPGKIATWICYPCFFPCLDIDPTVSRMY